MDETIAPEDLRDRALGLRESAHASRARLLAQAEAASRLRAELAVLKKNLAPRPAPARTEATATTAYASSAVVARTPAQPGRRAPSWTRWTPYAALVAAALVLEFGRRPVEAPAPPLDGLVRPAVSASPQGTAFRAPGAPTALEEDDRGGEALALVHAWRLPGDEETLLERLGADEERPDAEPSWSVHRSDKDSYLVIFQKDRDFPAYQFTADLSARTVTPSPGTAEALLAPELALSAR